MAAQPDPGEPIRAVEPPTGPRSDAREVALAEIQARLTSLSGAYVSGRVAVLLARHLGLDLQRPRGALAVGLATGAIRFLAPVAVTLALAGWDSAVPVWRWALFAGVAGGLDGMGTRRHREGGARIHDYTSLLSTIERESDARELLAFVRRWCRFRVSAPMAATVAAVVLVGCAAGAPAEFAALPVGSVVLLGILAYEVGEFVFFGPGLMVPFLLKEGHYEHRLPWLYPADAEPVRRTVHAWAGWVFLGGIVITVYVAFAALLVLPSWPVATAAVALFTVVGYLSTFASYFAVRSCVRSIASRIRDRHLQQLRDRVDVSEPALGRLSGAEAEELQHLVGIYAMVRDMPTTPSTSETLGHAAKALVIPTLAFFLAVLSEVYVERLLDQVLP